MVDVGEKCDNINLYFFKEKISTLSDDDIITLDNSISNLINILKKLKKSNQTKGEKGSLKFKSSRKDFSFETTKEQSRAMEEVSVNIQDSVYIADQLTSMTERSR